MMRFPKNKKLVVSALVAGILISATFAFRSPTDPVKPRENNLKVLPKDISHEELFDVMKSFNVALNFECSDCHARSSTDSTKLDFASYRKSEKRVALGMMKMVERINEKDFGIKGNFKDNYLQSKFEVTCVTCHNGHAVPASKISIPVEQRRDKETAYHPKNNTKQTVREHRLATLEP